MTTHQRDTRQLHQRSIQQRHRSSTIELIALAERFHANGDQAAVKSARDEAERRAYDQPPDGLAAQIAGYLGLLAEDTKHALADEACTWSRELHRVLAAEPSVPAPRPHAGRRAVRS